MTTPGFAAKATLYRSRGYSSGGVMPMLGRSDNSVIPSARAGGGDIVTVLERLMCRAGCALAGGAAGGAAGSACEAGSLGFGTPVCVAIGAAIGTAVSGECASELCDF